MVFNIFYSFSGFVLVAPLMVLLTFGLRLPIMTANPIAKLKRPVS